MRQSRIRKINITRSFFPADSSLVFTCEYLHENVWVEIETASGTRKDSVRKGHGSNRTQNRRTEKSAGVEEGCKRDWGQNNGREALGRRPDQGKEYRKKKQQETCSL